MNIKYLGIAGAVLMLGGPVFAHHSFAMFDYNKDHVVVGEVKELQWTNPHIHLFVNAPAPDGKGMAVWDIEGGTPNNLLRQGWSRTVVKPGDKVSVAVHPLKNGEPGGQLVSAKRGDGTQIGAAGAGGG
jgi:hypothetical protein